MRVDLVAFQSIDWNEEKEDALFSRTSNIKNVLFHRSHRSFNGLVFITEMHRPLQGSARYVSLMFGIEYYIIVFWNFSILKFELFFNKSVENRTRDVSCVINFAESVASSVSW